MGTLVPRIVPYPTWAVLRCVALAPRALTKQPGGMNAASLRTRMDGALNELAGTKTLCSMCQRPLEIHCSKTQPKQHKTRQSVWYDYPHYLAENVLPRVCRQLGCCGHLMPAAPLMPRTPACAS